VYLRFALNPVHIIDGLYLGGKTILTMRDRYNLAFTFYRHFAHCWTCKYARENNKSM